MPVKFISYLLLFTFTIYSFPGCSAGNSIRSSADNPVGYSDCEKFRLNKEKLYSVCLLVLQEKGYIIKLSDPETGLINAEFNSSSLIEEDEQELRNEDNTCANILSFLLIVGFIFLIVSALSSESGNSSGSDYCSEDESCTYSSSPFSSYQYNLTLTISSVNADTAACRILLIRSYVENGTVTSQITLMNKYFNYNFFNEIRRKSGSG